MASAFTYLEQVRPISRANLDIAKRLIQSRGLHNPIDVSLLRAHGGDLAQRIAESWIVIAQGLVSAETRTSCPGVDPIKPEWLEMTEALVWERGRSGKIDPDELKAKGVKLPNSILFKLIRCAAGMVFFDMSQGKANPSDKSGPPKAETKEQPPQPAAPAPVNGGGSSKDLAAKQSGSPKASGSTPAKKAKTKTPSLDFTTIVKMIEYLAADPQAKSDKIRGGYSDISDEFIYCLRLVANAVLKENSEVPRPKPAQKRSITAAKRYVRLKLEANPTRPYEELGADTEFPDVDQKKLAQFAQETRERIYRGIKTELEKALAELKEVRPENKKLAGAVETLNGALAAEEKKSAGLAADLEAEQQASAGFSGRLRKMAQRAWRYRQTAESQRVLAVRQIEEERGLREALEERMLRQAADTAGDHTDALNAKDQQAGELVSAAEARVRAEEASKRKRVLLTITLGAIVLAAAAFFAGKNSGEEAKAPQSDEKQIPKAN